MAAVLKSFSLSLAVVAGFSLLVGAVIPRGSGLAQRQGADAPVPSGLSPGMTEETLIARGDALLEAGDLASARLLYQAAANQGSARAAMLTGVTFDPRYRELAGASAPPSDAKLARQWYALAMRRGDAEARRNDLELVAWLKEQNVDPDAMAETDAATPASAEPEPETTDTVPPADPAGSANDEAVPEPAEASAEPAGVQSASPDTAGGSKVVRAQLTSAVKDREPVDRLPPSIQVSDGGVERIMFFSEVRDLSGRTLSHRWERQGQTMADVSFAVGSDSWRMHSSKRVTPAMTGAWRVVVVDETGAELASVPFTLE